MGGRSDGTEGGVPWLSVPRRGGGEDECGWQAVTVIPAGDARVPGVWRPAVAAGRRAVPLCPGPAPALEQLPVGRLPWLCLTGMEPGRSMSGDGSALVSAPVELSAAALAAGYVAGPPVSSTASSLQRVTLASGAAVSQALAVFYTTSCAGFEPPGPACADVSRVLSGESRCAFGAGDGCRPCDTLCPPGFGACAVCPGGFRHHPLPGFWSADEDSGSVLRCAPPAERRCPGWSGAEARSTCGEGFTGRSCARCESGFYSHSVAGCERCPSGTPAELLVMPILLYGGLAAGLCGSGLALFGLMQCLAPAVDRREALRRSALAAAGERGLHGDAAANAARAKVSKLLAKRGGDVPRCACDGGAARRAAGRALQLALWSVLSVQALVQVSRTLAPGVPSVVASVFGVLSVFELSPSVAVPPQCLTTAPLAVETAVLCAVLGLGATLGAMAAVVLGCHTRDARPWGCGGVAARAVPALFGLAAVTYALGTNTAVAVLHCLDLPADGVDGPVMASNPFVRCGSEEHARAAPLAVSLLVVVSGGLPVGTLVFAWARTRTVLRGVLARAPEDHDDGSGGTGNSHGSALAAPADSKAIGNASPGFASGRSSRRLVGSNNANRRASVADMLRSESAVVRSDRGREPTNGHSESRPLRSASRGPQLQPGLAAQPPAMMSNPLARGGGAPAPRQATTTPRAGSMAWQRSDALALVKRSASSGPRVTAAPGEARANQVGGCRSTVCVCCPCFGRRTAVAGPDAPLTLGSLLDSSRTVRADRALGPCVARDYRPSRGWHIPAGLLSVGIMGAAGEVLVASPARSWLGVLVSTVLVTVLCLALSTAVLCDQPYAPGHLWKRWLRALTLLLAALTSWLNMTQLSASGGLPPPEDGAGNIAADAVAAVAVLPLSFMALVLSCLLVGAIAGAIVGALGRDTAVAVLLERRVWPTLCCCGRWCSCGREGATNAVIGKQSGRKPAAMGGPRLSGPPPATLVASLTPAKQGKAARPWGTEEADRAAVAGNAAVTAPAPKRPTASLSRARLSLHPAALAHAPSRVLDSGGLTASGEPTSDGLAFPTLVSRRMLLVPNSPERESGTVSGGKSRVRG